MLKSFLTGFLIGLCKMQSLKLRNKAEGLACQARQLEELAEKLDYASRPPPVPPCAPLN